MFQNKPIICIHLLDVFSNIQDYFLQIWHQESVNISQGCRFKLLSSSGLKEHIDITTVKSAYTHYQNRTELGRWLRSKKDLKHLNINH